MGNDPILEPKHKIFLSHSGAQKEFAEHLCKALEDRLQFPFFDGRHKSLPKGEQFPELIVQAAKQCEMLIVVVSDEYFLSKWPMIELSAFVKAHKLHHESKSSTKGPKILPLFYGLSADDLEDATLQKKWLRKWETLAKADKKNRIIASDWKYALDVLRSFNGLPYDRNLKKIVAYEEEIVSCVCKSIPPNIKWNDSHVQGKSSILKVIGEKIEGIEVSRQYKVKVIGIYGVGGIGKTTMCKTLCNELSSKYEGRVCHIEFPIEFPIDPSSVFKEFFQKLLKDLTRKSMDVVQDWRQYKDILHNSLFEQKTFLAIDNILVNHQSIQLAKTLLNLTYHPDSLVVVTTRSQSVLELLGLDGDACLEMPDIGEADALRLFLHHANIGGKEFFKEDEKHDILTCVKRCLFSKGDGQGDHYHPLALQSLGLQLGCSGDNPSIWVKNLPQVVRLKQKGLVVDVDLRSKRISIHDLYYEFALLEAKGSLNEKLDWGERKWFHVDDGNFTELESKPRGGCWHKMIRLTIKHLCETSNITNRQLCPNEHNQVVGRIASLEDIKWDYFSNLEVLQLCGLDSGHGALNLGDLGRLRILELVDVRCRNGIQGLEKLKHLTYFSWIRAFYYKLPPSLPYYSHDMGTHIIGQLPSSLKRLRISDPGVVLHSNLFPQCHHLSKLELRWVKAHSLDLSNCSSLETVSILGIQKLQTLSVFTASRPSNLQFLDVTLCNNLVDIPGIEHLIGLKKLKIAHCEEFEVLNLNGFNQLEVLSLSGNTRLTSLGDLGDLSALRHLDLSNCNHLLRLPDLSKSKNLQELNLEGCSALELHAKDIQMLSELPLLQPVPFFGMGEQGKFWLDFVQKKVLVRLSDDRAPPFGESWKAGEWEERALGSPPIKIGKRGTWDSNLVVGFVSNSGFFYG